MNDRLSAGAARIALAAAAVALLSAAQCSFDGHPLFDFNSDSPQTTVAAISGFGSVFAGGDEFTTSSGSVMLDGAAVSELQLRPGQVASVVGTLSQGGPTGTATSLAVTDKLVGPVSATDAASGSFTVLGATVRVTGDTSVGLGIAPADVAGLAIGTNVAIDGYRTSTGLIATRIDPALAGQLVRVAGPVASLSGFALQFKIGPTTIDYSHVQGGLPPQVTNGSYVVASGGTITGAATLQATQIAIVSETPGGAKGANGRVHGAITRFGSSSDFDVGGQSISAGGATIGNGTGSDLALDVEVEVDGAFDANGVLDASAVNIAPAASFRVVGPISSLGPTAGAAAVAGITLQTDSRTIWDDLSATALRTLGYPDLRTGDWIEARGVAGASGTAQVRVLERRAQPNPAFIELQGVPASLANPSLTISGVAIDASSASFYDASGQALSRNGFFAQASGRVVRVVGSFIGTTLTAETVALRP